MKRGDARPQAETTLCRVRLSVLAHPDDRTRMTTLRRSIHACWPAAAVLALVGLTSVIVSWPRGLPADLLTLFDAQWLQARQAEVLAWQAAEPVLFCTGFFVAFAVLSATALPGCGVLALLAGMCFGWLVGTLVVAVASTVGATAAFLVARRWWRDAVRRRWGHRLVAVEAGLARDGALYLFALRLAPVIPYALINPLMGLTGMSTRLFASVSLVGMLAGSAVYAYAGALVGRAASPHDLFTPGLAAAMLALTLLPWVASRAWRHRQQQRQPLR